MIVQPPPEQPDNSAGPPDDRSLADVVLEDRGESRQLRGAAIVALLFHFAVFAMVVPFDARIIDFETREATVIKRYRPPLPPEVKKPVRQHRTRVPIPDLTPFDPEPLLDEEVEFETPPESADTEFVVAGPVAMPEPTEILNAVDIETEGLEPPRLVRRVPPQYDPERARRGVQGKVDLQIVIGQLGLVEFARVINGTDDDELDRRALEAVRQWEFEPATMQGEAVTVRAMVTINYRIY